MNTSVKMTKVIVVDDEEETLELLETVLNNDQSIELLASYTNAEDAVEGILELNPDLVVMDISLPGISGIAGMIQVKLKLPNTHFLMYTAFEDRRLADSIIAGADGYLLKHDPTEKLIPAIKNIIEESLEMKQEITKNAVDYFSQKSKSTEDPYNEEEIKLMKKISEGWGNKEIAFQENTTEGAIKQRLFKLFKKAQVRNRAEMVKIYLENIE
ncbi:response regulator transcription factor [Haliscomenobacter sp.]|uniref:response regulator transcription factor n=1 Tax=Haliscomenobacter sp. TaxID=2717303 RepID=UPI003364B6B1